MEKTESEKIAELTIETLRATMSYYFDDYPYDDDDVKYQLMAKINAYDLVRREIEREVLDLKNKLHNSV